MRALDLWILAKEQQAAQPRLPGDTFTTDLEGALEMAKLAQEQIATLEADLAEALMALPMFHPLKNGKRRG